MQMTTHKPIYVPQALRNQLLQIAHGDALFGQVGAQSTNPCESCINGQEWRLMWRNSFKIVRCVNLLTSPQQKLLGYYSLFQFLRCLRLILDFVGGFQPTFLGNTHILVAIDLFSKYVVALPTKDMTANTVADFLLLG